MTNDPIQRRWFQVSLKNMLLVVAAICTGLAMLKSGYQLLAIWVAFPFAAGLVVGDLVPSLWASFVIAAIAHPFVISILWGIIGHVFWRDQNQQDISILGSVFSSLFLVPGLFQYGLFPAIAGSALAQWLSADRR